MVGPVYNAYSNPVAALMSGGAFGAVQREEPLNTEEVFDMMLRKECDKVSQLRIASPQLQPTFNRFDYSRATAALALMNQLSGTAPSLNVETPPVHPEEAAAEPAAPPQEPLPAPRKIPAPQESLPPLEGKTEIEAEREQFLQKMQQHQENLSEIDEEEEDIEPISGRI
ncbi:MAG: hypothetical protein RDV48_02645 [Candidatus Eremiobacteraeota bacterium]|nr:hypothetical protein [Candidatus Eremiobacteraeota bacterium]